MGTAQIKPRALGVLLTLVVLALAPVAWAGEPGARIISVKGTVEVSSASPGTWISAQAESLVRPGDAIRTGSRSSAVVQLDGARVTLYETTLLRIPVSATTASTAAPNPFRHPVLDAGRALFNVRPLTPKKEFSVRTPMLVAGVKGTIFEVIATESEQAVYVWEGAVQVESVLDPHEIQMVVAGEHTLMEDHRLMPHAPTPSERERPPDAHRDAAVPHEAPTASSVGEAIETRSAEPTPSVNENTVAPMPFDQAFDAEPERAIEAFPDRELTETVEAWRDADRAAFGLASDAMTEFQTIITSGESRLAVSTALKTDSTTTTTVTDPVDSTSTTSGTTQDSTTTTDPVIGTVDSTTDALADTTSTPTTGLTSTLDTTTDALADTTDTTIDSLTGLLGL